MCTLVTDSGKLQDGRIKAGAAFLMYYSFHLPHLAFDYSHPFLWEYLKSQVFKEQTLPPMA